MLWWDSMEKSRTHHKAAETASQWPVHGALLLAQLLSGGYFVITRVALESGGDRIVLSFYRDVIALLFLVPAAYMLDRNNSPRLTWTVAFRLFLLGLTGIFGSQFLLFLGIELTSAEFSSALQPLVPVFTAAIAIVFGVEVVRWYRRDGQVKVAGITICCVGAILMTFYKGPAVVGKHASTVGELYAAWLYKLISSGPGFLGLPSSRHQLGALCLVGNCICYATYINLQAPLLRMFPAPASVTAYAYAFGTALMGIAGFFLVDNRSSWALGWDISLVAVLYNGIISSALYFGLMTWSISRVGPLFVASYIPVQPVFTTILALIFLGSTVYLGGILGTALIIVGLLMVSWARQESVRLGTLSLLIESATPTYYGNQADTLDLGLREPLLEA